MKFKEIKEAHPNSKIYDQCWDGYRKVPGTLSGEKGSCEKISNEAYDAWDEADVWYQFDTSTKKLKQKTWYHAQEREARANGWHDSHDKAMRAHGYFPSKFKKGEYVIKGADDKWIKVYPYADKTVKEFAPGNGGTPPRGPKTPGGDPWGGNDGPGDDPYSRPEPKHYSRSIDFFGRFEADHFDDEVFDEKTGVFKGYWDDEEGRVQIAYFKFDEPTRTGSDDPGMGWYYEPASDGNSNNTSAKPAVDMSAQRKQQELGMIDAFLKSGKKPQPGSQIHSLMKKHGLAEGRPGHEEFDKGYADAQRGIDKNPFNPNSPAYNQYRKGQEAYKRNFGESVKQSVAEGSEEHDIVNSRLPIKHIERKLQEAGLEKDIRIFLQWAIDNGSAYIEDAIELGEKAKLNDPQLLIGLHRLKKISGQGVAEGYNLGGLEQGKYYLHSIYQNSQIFMDPVSGDPMSFDNYDEAESFHNGLGGREHDEYQVSVFNQGKLLPADQGVAEGFDNDPTGPATWNGHRVVANRRTPKGDFLILQNKNDGKYEIHKQNPGVVGGLEFVSVHKTPDEMQSAFKKLTGIDESNQGVAEASPRVDSLVTDALKIMRGAEVSDAVSALKTVLGDREYNSRRGHYNFYVRQLMDMYNQQDIAEGSEFGAYYHEQLAQKVFDADPTLNNEDAILNNGYAIAKKELGARAQGIFNAEDFAGDFVSAYTWLQKQAKDKKITKETQAVTDNSLGYKNTLAVMKAADSSQEATINLGDEPVTLDYPEARFIAGKYKAFLRAGRQEEFFGLMANPAKFDGMMKQLRGLVDKQKNFKGSVPGDRGVPGETQTPWIREGVDNDSPVAGAITHRIMIQRHDLLSKYGPAKVMAAIDDVADFAGDVEEIGSSDVSAWVKQVEQSLAGMGESELDEGWKEKLGAAALAGTLAFGAAGNAMARVTPDGQGGYTGGKPVATQMAPAATQAAQPGAEMPGKNLQTVDNIEGNKSSGYTITQDGKSYDVKVVPKGSPTPRGAKMMKVSQAQVGERGIGNYVVYLLNSGTAYLYMGGSVSESMKLIGKHGEGAKTAKVYKDHEWGEFRVKFYTDGKHEGEEADYHTDDRSDANDTAKSWTTKGEKVAESTYWCRQEKTRKLIPEGYKKTAQGYITKV
jgi:hypothetical protein